MKRGGEQGLAAFHDLQEFINLLAQKKLLKPITTEVDPYLEITEITDRIVKSGGEALYFSQVKGSSYPVVTNLFGSLERINLALGVNDLDEIGKRIEEYFTTMGGMKKGIFGSFKNLATLAEVKRFFPQKVNKAPCQEVIETNPDLSTLPILQCWPHDGGRYLTLPLVFTKDPDTGEKNCGMYRMQVFDGQTTGMHWHLHKDGSQHFQQYQLGKKMMEVAVVLGGDPASIYAASAPLPKGIDEMFFAGFLRQSPVAMVPCKTVDLEVLAHAEFVLEGYIDPHEKRIEGPFGDHTGYYSSSEEYPVFHLTCLTRKRKPIYPAMIVGKPFMEDALFGKATERIFLPFIKILLPEIVDWHFPPEGVFHNCLIVAIKKRYPGQGKKVIHALWGLNQLCFTKLIIVVDQEVNVQDLKEVGWIVLGNLDVKRDVVIAEGPLDSLDHASNTPLYGSKLGIDATKKGPEEGYERTWPLKTEMSFDIKELVTRRWKEYGFT